MISSLASFGLYSSAASIVVIFHEQSPSDVGSLRPTIRHRNKPVRIGGVEIDWWWMMMQDHHLDVEPRQWKDGRMDRVGRLSGVGNGAVYPEVKMELELPVGFGFSTVHFTVGVYGGSYGWGELSQWYG